MYLEQNLKILRKQFWLRTFKSTGTELTPCIFLNSGYKIKQGRNVLDTLVQDLIWRKFTLSTLKNSSRMRLTLTNAAGTRFRTDLTSSIQTIQALRFNGRIRFMRQKRSKRKTIDKLVVFRKVLCGTFPICAILCLSDSYTLTSQLTFIWCYKY